MGAGALSDSQVVEKSKLLVPILVDCTQDGAHKDLRSKYGVRAFPTLLFLNSSGATIGEMSSRDAASLAAQIESAATGKPMAAVQPGSSSLTLMTLIIPLAVVIVFVWLIQKAKKGS